jgi:hypothetical protein
MKAGDILVELDKLEVGLELALEKTRLLKKEFEQLRLEGKL